MKALALLLTLGFLNHGCFHVSPDSFPEEYLEDVIEDYTGLDIDFTSTDSE